MADQPHAVGDEVGERGARPGRARRLASSDDVAAARPGSDRCEGGLLRAVDLGQKVLELGIRLTEHAHPREIADVATEVAARIDRQHLARPPGLPRVGAVVAGADRQQAVVEVQASPRLLAPQPQWQPACGFAFSASARVAAEPACRIRRSAALVAAIAGAVGQVLEAERKLGLEGLVGKPIDSAYEPGERSGVWIKHRTNREQEFVYIHAYVRYYVSGHRPYGGRDKAIELLA